MQLKSARPAQKGLKVAKLIRKIIIQNTTAIIWGNQKNNVLICDKTRVSEHPKKHHFDSYYTFYLINHLIPANLGPSKFLEIQKSIEINIITNIKRPNIKLVKNLNIKYLHLF